MIDLFLKIHTETLLTLDSTKLQHCLHLYKNKVTKETKKERKKAGELTRPLRPLYWDSSPHSDEDLQNTTKRKVKVTLTAMTSALPDGDASLVAQKFHNPPVCNLQELHKTH